MKCAWQAYLSLLPHWMKAEVDRLGKHQLLELRLRVGMPPQLLLNTGSVWLTQTVSKDDLSFCVNAASRYSPWAASSVEKGYITAPGGHRIGLCGSCVIHNHEMTGIRSVSSLCIRVARDFTGCAGNAKTIEGSILIVGKPGSGKTTLLRDLIRQRAEAETVAVVDEKEEIFPVCEDQLCFFPGKQTDVLTGVSKIAGIETLLRNMGPQTIAVDEITAKEDCLALLHAGWCGVNLLATAHAANMQELSRRKVYRPILDSGLFENFLVMQPDKSWRLERRIP